MNIYLVPQIPLDTSERIIYEFEDSKIRATLNGVTEEYDFSMITHGVLDIIPEEVETSLDIYPIISALKDEGGLHVELRNYIGTDAKYEENYPKWIDSSQYIAPEIPDKIEDEAPEMTNLEIIERELLDGKAELEFEKASLDDAKREVADSNQGISEEALLEYYSQIDNIKKEIDVKIQAINVALEEVRIMMKDEKDGLIVVSSNTTNGEESLLEGWGDF